jgi:hypothetical protein
MNPNKLREKLKTGRGRKKNSLQEKGLIIFRVGRDHLDEGLVPVSVLNQGPPVYVGGEVFLGSSQIASVSPTTNSELDISIRFNLNGVRRVNGLRDMDGNFSLVLYINNYPVQNVIITQEITKASEIKVPFNSEEERNNFLDYYRQ